MELSEGARPARQLALITQLDVVTCRFGLMFCPRIDQALREAYRVLKPGGRAVFLVWGPPDQPFFSSTLGVLMKYVQLPPPPPGAPTPWRFARQGSLAAALQGAGFARVQETAHTIPLSWPGPPEEMWAALGEMQAALARPVTEALDADQLARVTAEAHGALHQYYDGCQVTTPAQVISGVGL